MGSRSEWKEGCGGIRAKGQLLLPLVTECLPSWARFGALVEPFVVRNFLFVFCSCVRNPHCNYLLRRKLAIHFISYQVAARSVEALMRGDRTMVPGWQNKLYVHFLAPLVSWLSAASAVVDATKVRSATLRVDAASVQHCLVDRCDWWIGALSLYSTFEKSCPPSPCQALLPASSVC